MIDIKQSWLCNRDLIWYIDLKFLETDYQDSCICSHYPKPYWFLFNITAFYWLISFICLYCCVWIIGKSLSLKLTYYAVAEVDTVITLSPLIRIVPRLFDLSFPSNNSTESRKNKFICWSYRTKVPVIIFLPFSLMSTDLPMFSWRTFPIMSTDDNSSLTGIQTI